MPLTAIGRRILREYRHRYGWDHGEEYFYRSIAAKRPGTSKWHRKSKKRRTSMPRRKHHRRRLAPRSRKTGRFLKRGRGRRARRGRARRRRSRLDVKAPVFFDLP